MTGIRLKAVASEPVQRQLLLTKGDNNHVDDLELYQGLDWLERRHIIGKVRGYVSLITVSCPFTFHPFNLLEYCASYA
jgi:hypothetical protein